MTDTLVERMVEIADRDDTNGLAADALREGAETICAMKRSNAEKDEALRIGDEVTVVYDSLDPSWRDDWIDWSGFVAGIQFDLKTATLNYTVCDQWPPKNNGDISDGFYEGSLARKALSHSSEEADAVHQ